MSEAKPKQPMTVVVVDDEQSITEVLEMTLRYAVPDIHLEVFNDATLARNFLMNNKVDVLITDYKMPHYNGLELMEVAAPEVKKVLISGYVSEIAEEKLTRLNAIFFEKPVPFRKLTDIIKQEIELKKLF